MRALLPSLASSIARQNVDPTSRMTYSRLDPLRPMRLAPRRRAALGTSPYRCHICICHGACGRGSGAAGHASEQVPIKVKRPLRSVSASRTATGHRTQLRKTTGAQNHTEK